MEIFFLCLGFIALPFVGWGVVELVRAYVLPPRRFPARLKRKDAPKQETMSGKSQKKYRLVFEIDGEKKRSFFVSKDAYILARVGTDGTLTVRGRRFISFN